MQVNWIHFSPVTPITSTTYYVAKGHHAIAVLGKLLLSSSHPPPPPPIAFPSFVKLATHSNNLRIIVNGKSLGLSLSLPLSLKFSAQLDEHRPVPVRSMVVHNINKSLNSINWLYLFVFVLHNISHQSSLHTLHSIYRPTALAALPLIRIHSSVVTITSLSGAGKKTWSMYHCAHPVSCIGLLSPLFVFLNI